LIGEKKYQFGLIGCGNIGCAIANGLIKYGNLSAEKICASETDARKSERFKQLFNIEILPHNILARNSRFILLAVKPKDIPQLCSEISQFLDDSSIIISVAAGITIESLHGFFGKRMPVVRMMPNLAIENGKGIIGYCWENVDSDALKELIEIFSRVSFCFPVKEQDMFLITAVAGSGPGFLFYLAEIIHLYLRERKFDEETARKITAALFEGTGLMLALSNQTPSALKERVCSPGGTTLAGLERMQKENIKKILIDAFDAALKRAVELSEYNGTHTHGGHNE